MSIFDGPQKNMLIPSTVKGVEGLTTISYKMSLRNSNKISKQFAILLRTYATNKEF